MLVVVSKAEGKIEFLAVVSPPKVCANNIKIRHQQCIDHYERVLADTAQDVGDETFRCPFGFSTKRPFSAVPPMLISALEVPRLVTKDGIGRIILNPDPERKSAWEAAAVIAKVAKEISGYEYSHLDAALHEVRNINLDISITAEEYLLAKGVDQDHLDHPICDNSADLATARSVFVASRELSSALTLHEISRAPETAKDKPTKQSLLALCKQQGQVSFARLRKAGMTLQLPDSDVTATLTLSTSYLPKILIDNAIKHGIPNTQIRVGFSEIEGGIQLFCENASKPFTKADEALACEREYRGSNASQSTTSKGLGLWLASVICKANNGSINLRYIAGATAAAGVARVEVMLKPSSNA